MHEFNQLNKENIRLFHPLLKQSGHNESPLQKGAKNDTTAHDLERSQLTQLSTSVGCRHSWYKPSGSGDENGTAITHCIAGRQGGKNAYLKFTNSPITWSILPTRDFPLWSYKNQKRSSFFGHLVNFLLTKLVQSRFRVDIGLGFFFGDAIDLKNKKWALEKSMQNRMVRDTPTSTSFPGSLQRVLFTMRCTPPHAPWRRALRDDPRLQNVLKSAYWLDKLGRPVQMDRNWKYSCFQWAFPL